MHILIADDESPVTDLMENYFNSRFTDRGCRATFHRAWRTEDILTIARTAPIDLSFLFINNIHAPGRVSDLKHHAGQCLELIGHLRRVRNRPIIVSSMYDEETLDAKMVYGAGGDFYFPGPMRLDGFGAAVDAIMGRSYAVGEPAPEDVPECVKIVIADWDSLAFFAYDRYEKLGPVAIRIEWTDDASRSARLRVIPFDRGGLLLAADAWSRFPAYDPAQEVLFQFMDTQGRCRTQRLRPGAKGRHPRSIWFFDMLRRLHEEPGAVKLADLPGWFAEMLRNAMTPGSHEWVRQQ